MANRIIYPKDLREKAAAENRDLFAYGYDGCGKFECTCSVPRGEGAKLALFLLKVTRGESPEEAFAVCFQSKKTSSAGVDPLVAATRASAETGAEPDSQREQDNTLGDDFVGGG